MIIYKKDLEKATKRASIAFKKRVPNPKTRGVGYYINQYGNKARCSTGNMMRSTKYSVPHYRRAVISCKTDYIVYTNEPWISPKWKGHKNPNEGWVKKAVFTVARSYANSLGGKVVMK